MDYTEWMDGPSGYREWYAANYVNGAAASKPTGPQPNSGDNGPPPPPPKKP